MKDAERIETIRRQAESLHGGGYWAGPGVPSEACYDIRFLLAQLDKTEAALRQTGWCERCDEQDRHRAEAEDGMLNAAEIAGLQ